MDLKVLLLLVPVCSYASPKYYPITRVIDGDTIAFKADFLPSELKPELSLRLWGVDTPEKGKRANCQQELELGDAASNFTKQAIERSTDQKIDIRDWDKFGGRVVGDLYLDGVNLRTELIKHGYAREYYGAKKESWCK